MANTVIIQRGGIPGPGSDVLQLLVEEAQVAADLSQAASEEAVSAVSNQVAAMGSLAGRAQIYSIMDVGASLSFAVAGSEALFSPSYFRRGLTASNAPPPTSYMIEGGDEGAFFIEADLPSIPALSQTIAEWSDETENNRIVVSFTADGEIAIYVVAGGGSGVSTVVGVRAPGDRVLVGSRWSAGVFSFFLDGVSRGDLVALAPTFNTVSIASDYTGGGDFAGAVRRVATFASAPGLSEMSRMTRGEIAGSGGVVRIAASNTSEEAKAGADIVCDGIDDQVEINAALSTYDTVLLLDGIYHVNRTNPLPIEVDPLPQPGLDVQGAVLVTRSHSTLMGQSRNAIIRLGDGEQCNVIRTIGSSLTDIEICNLTIDPNRANNDASGNEWLENCGIKTRTTGDAATTRNSNIRIHDITIGDVDGLGAYIWGDDVHLWDSHFENADNDCAELCDGTGGSIRGCTAVISGTVGYVFGTDQFNDFTITENKTTVTATGYVTGAVHRLWPGYYRGTVSNNTVQCEPGGRINSQVKGFSYLTVFSGNVFRGHNNFATWGRTKIELNTTCIFTGNAVSFCKFVTVQAAGPGQQLLPTDAAGKTLITSNMLENSEAPPADDQLEFSLNVEFSF